MSWGKVKFLDAVDDITGGNKKFQNSEYQCDGIFPIIDQGESIIGGYTNSPSVVKREKPIIIFGDHTKALKYVDFDFCLGADGVKVLQPKKGLFPKFLFHYLGTIQLPNVGYSRHYKFLKDIQIPLPPLHIQKQIANILDKADALRKKDQELLQKYDELAQSIFIDMFGDPVKNEKGWEVMELGKCIDKLTVGNSYGGEDKILNKDEIGVLKVSAVTSGIFRSDQYKAVNKKLVKKNIIKVKKGDLLFSRANTRELVGATCVVDQNYDHLFLPDKLWRIDLNKNKCLNYFIKFLLSQEGIRYNLNKAATGTSGSMLNISMQKLRDLEIIMPGLSFQIKFEKVIDNLLLQRKINTYSFDQTENLFQSLLQKAFTGELIHD